MYLYRILNDINPEGKRIFVLQKRLPTSGHRSHDWVKIYVYPYHEWNNARLALEHLNGNIYPKQQSTMGN